LSVAAILIALVVGVVAPLAAAATFPSWDSQFNGPARFVMLNQFGGAAVLDRETGLVWEQSPSTSLFTWFDAQIHCNTLNVGNRKGWGLPTIQELASLIDPSQVNPALPQGHPFNVQLVPFCPTGCGIPSHWSATENLAILPTQRGWQVSFADGSVVAEGRNGLGFGPGTEFAWCVRGGHGVDAQ
jgi:uncharacterized protein DUF1566